MTSRTESIIAICGAICGVAFIVGIIFLIITSLSEAEIRVYEYQEIVELKKEYPELDIEKYRSNGITTGEYNKIKHEVYQIQKNKVLKQLDQ